MKAIANMSAADYHAVPALSSSGIKKMLVSAQDFWVSSWMNPDRYEPESDAFNLGTAYHVRMLEGENMFLSKYAEDFDGKAHPDALVTISDIKAAILNMGVKPVTKTESGKPPVKDDYIAQLSIIDPSAKVLDTLKDSHTALHGGKTMLPAHVFKQIQAAGARCDAKGIFKGGVAEYSVFWTDEETGVPMKARFDYLKPGIIDDLKTFSNPNGHPLPFLTANHIQRYKYHLQMAVYDEAHKLVVGQDAQIQIVFQQTGPANNLIVRPFAKDLVSFQQGRDLMREGINKFAEMYRRYGNDPWYDEYGSMPIKDEEFSFYMFE